MVQKIYLKITSRLPAGMTALLDSTVASKEWRGVQMAKIKVFFKRRLK